MFVSLRRLPRNSTFVQSEQARGTPSGMISELPQNLSALTPERMSHAAGVRDKRISALFKRWPTLSKVETSELKRLYNERLRLAKSVGTMRRHRRLRRGSGGENAGRELRRSYVAGDPERSPATDRAGAILRPAWSRERSRRPCML